MSKTLAELRASREKKLPTRIATVCLDLEALADAQRLQAEKENVLLEARRHNDDGDGPPARLGETIPPRVAEIEAELSALWDRMRESEGELLLRAIPGGEWQRWKDEHPPRDDNRTDEQTTFGVCNGQDLLNDLGRFVVSWNGEQLAEGDWDTWLADQIAPADLAALVGLVVEMHEVRITVPKSSPVSSATQVPADA